SGVAASDPDIAQGAVAEVHQLVARVGAPSPGAQMSFQQAPTRRAMRLGRRNAHGTSPGWFASTRRRARPFCTGIVQAAGLPGRVAAHGSRAVTPIWPSCLGAPSGSGQRTDEIARVGGGSLECLV